MSPNPFEKQFQPFIIKNPEDLDRLLTERMIADKKDIIKIQGTLDILARNPDKLSKFQEMSKRVEVLKNRIGKYPKTFEEVVELFELLQSAHQFMKNAFEGELDQNKVGADLLEAFPLLKQYVDILTALTFYAQLNWIDTLIRCTDKSERLPQ
jgi:hypothetical protein